VLAQDYTPCLTWPAALLTGTALLLIAMMMLVGSLKTQYTAPKTWSYWTTLAGAVIGSAACFWYLFGHW